MTSRSSAAVPVSNPSSALPAPTRLLSLDLLRGLTIAFMILVNNNGDGDHAFWPLKHASWNGFTPTDLVFPTFLLLVGVSTVLSLSARLRKGAAKRTLFLHVLRRSAILFALGLLVNSYPHFHLHTLRIYGVLPRIAICYLLVAGLYLLSPRWRKQAIIAAVALLGYWVLLRFVRVPGYGFPTHDVPLLDRDANLTAWLDRQIFPPSHLYEHTRDPEGLLSTLPALATALIGLLTGIWLQTSRTIAQKAQALATAGLSGVLLGGLWNLSFPVNKKLWTSSFVLFAAGWSLLLFALFLWLADIRERRAEALGKEEPHPLFFPLLVFGKNAIAAYVFSELLQGTITSIHLPSGIRLQRWLYGQLHLAVTDAPLASLIYSLAFVAICWLPMYLLYHRRIFLKI